MKILIIAILLVSILSSCIEKYELDKDSREQKLVVEGLISNINEELFDTYDILNEPDRKMYNYIKLTKSSSKLISDSINFYEMDTIDAINDAIVIIRDNSRNIDTLQAALPTRPMYIQDSNGEIMDTAIIENEFYKAGYYFPKTIKGIAGRTYNLEIQHNGETYRASCKMPQTPKIDSITYQFTKGEPGKYDFCIPHIFFDNLNNKDNYYLFDFSKFTGMGSWNISILNDKNIGDYVNGLDVFKGQTIDWWITAYPMPCDPFLVEMHSLTKEGYDFYSSLIQAFNNDGGTYRPAPATAPGNISNGALGFFRASSIEIVNEYVPCDY